MAKPKKTADPAEVEKLAGEGLAEYQIAASLAMHPETFSRIKREEPDVEAALERGRRAAVGTIEHVAFNAAKQADDDPRYTTAMIFWLKCNAGWKDVQHIEHGGAVGVYDARARLAEKLARLVAGTSADEGDDRRAVAELSEEDADALLHDWRLWARPEQVWPGDDGLRNGAWLVWLVLAGRGWGKTRTGAEAVREVVASGRVRRIALVGPTAADARDTMVEGESGLLSVFPSGERPEYEPSKRRVTFANGALATLYSAEEPERLRGPQHGFAWCDELRAWKYADDAWDNLQFGLRLGEHPRVVATTTGKPTRLLRELIRREGVDVVVTRGHTLDNAAHLPPSQLRYLLGQLRRDDGRAAGAGRRGARRDAGGAVEPGAGRCEPGAGAGRSDADRGGRRPDGE